MTTEGRVADAELLRRIEALLFVSDEPVPASVLAPALGVDRRRAEALCEELASVYEERNAGLVLRNVAGGWRLATHPDVAPTVERFVLSSRQARLTKAALETLAIVAYKQPVTRHQIAQVRGVNSDGVLRALVERGLVQEVGREESPGRPVLYGTTPAFLERLGLPSLAALPSLAPLLGADGAGEERTAEPGGTGGSERSEEGSPRAPGHPGDPEG
ncbi:MAG TPA: SMC-Scp complex subunit ScpB [Actinomycetota bacterium]|nr:SMC-Scp complex subunit ScpB [Actinomycetota bacterium]